jgi:dipeptidyl aminopeptidase/acylaminoacyl peptidase
VRLLDETDSPIWTFVSRDGRTLLFNSRRSGSSNLWLTSLAAGSTPRQMTAVAGSTLTHSSLSPDGTRAAFVSFASGTASIWSQNVDGSELRQLTKDDAADSWPVWSPDGRRIVYTSTRHGAQETRVMAADGTGNEKLIDGFFRGDWIEQPDGTGTWIVTSDGNRGVRLIDTEERRVIWETQLPSGGLSLPVFSPDARRISVPFQEARDRYAIQVLDVASGKGETLVRLSFNINFRAAWTDEGTALIVNRLDAVSHVVLFDRFWDDTVR